MVTDPLVYSITMQYMNTQAVKESLSLKGSMGCLTEDAGSEKFDKAKKEPRRGSWMGHRRGHR